MSSLEGVQQKGKRLWKLLTVGAVVASVLLLSGYIFNQNQYAIVACGVGQGSGIYHCPAAYYQPNHYSQPLLLAGVFSYAIAFIFSFKGWPLRGHRSIPSD